MTQLDQASCVFVPDLIRIGRQGDRGLKLSLAIVCAVMLGGCQSGQATSGADAGTSVADSPNSHVSSQGSPLIRRDANTGAVKSWRGDDLAADMLSRARYDSALASRDVVAMAGEFLRAKESELRLDHTLMNFKARPPETGPTGDIQVRLGQYLGTIPVVHSMIILSFDSDLRLRQFHGDYLPSPVAIDLQPRLDWEQACTLGESSTPDLCKARNEGLVVYRSPGRETRLAYAAAIHSPVTMSRVVYLDANSGRVLFEEPSTYPAN